VAAVRDELGPTITGSDDHVYGSHQAVREAPVKPPGPVLFCIGPPVLPYTNKKTPKIVLKFKLVDGQFTVLSDKEAGTSGEQAGVCGIVSH
jgi:hypothetical protein